MRICANPDIFPHYAMKQRTLHIMTLSRIPLSFAFLAILLIFARPGIYIPIGVALLLVAELSDLFDGYFARRMKLISEFGAMLDPYADSVSRLAIYSSLAFKGLAIFWVPLAMAIRDVTVSYCRIILVKHNRTVSARLSGKIKAEVQSVSAFIMLLSPLYPQCIGLWLYYAISWIVIIVTAISSVEYIRDAYRALVQKP